MVRRLEGKIAIVTGGTSGIGLATAKQFAADGAQVFITGRRQDALDAAVTEIGEKTTGVRADASSMSDLGRLFDQVKTQAGRIDILFVNAGGGTMLPLGSITEEHYVAIFDSNVKGVLFTVQMALPLLADGASVILVGSTAGSLGTPAFSVYAASKAAVRSFSRNWILDLKDRRIRVNTLSPGPIRTPGLLGLAGPDATAQQGLLDYFAAKVPTGRVGEPDEVARAAVFLASDDASFVNGIELFVDGGMAQV